MKAIVIREPGKGVAAWKLVDRPEPKPGPGEVLVRVRAASLNYRDLEAMNRALEQLRIAPVIDEVFPIERARDALVKLETGKHFGKIVVRIE